jgi:hypothetical protein
VCVCVGGGIQSGGVSSSVGFNRLFPTVAIFIVVIYSNSFHFILNPEQRRVFQLVIYKSEEK